MQLSPNADCNVGNLPCSLAKMYLECHYVMFFSVICFVVTGSGTDCDRAHFVPDLRAAVQCDHVFFLGFGDSIVWEVKNQVATSCFFKEVVFMHTQVPILKI